MAQTITSSTPLARSNTNNQRMKFLIGGALIIGAIILLIATTMQSTMQYYYTVDEITAKGSALTGQNIRASGAVLGESIQFDPATLEVSFMMVHVPGDLEAIDQAGGLAALLHDAVSHPNANRIKVVYVGPKPDLLRNEAQAIVTGKLGADGVFYADELLLKCPTRYEESSKVSGN